MPQHGGFILPRPWFDAGSEYCRCVNEAFVLNAAFLESQSRSLYEKDNPEPGFQSGPGDPVEAN